MEQKNMSFDEIWEREERKGLLQRLQGDYPAWLRRRRVRRTVLASVAVLAVTGSIALLSPSATLRSYDAVCCNRSGIAEGHWANVASNILITTAI